MSETTKRNWEVIGLTPENTVVIQVKGRHGPTDTGDGPAEFLVEYLTRTERGILRRGLTNADNNRKSPRGATMRIASTAIAICAGIMLSNTAIAGPIKSGATPVTVNAAVAAPNTTSTGGSPADAPRATLSLDDIALSIEDVTVDPDDLVSDSVREPEGVATTSIDTVSGPHGIAPVVTGAVK